MGSAESVRQMQANGIRLMGNMRKKAQWNERNYRCVNQKIEDNG